MDSPTHLPTPGLLLMLRLMMLHTSRRCEKVYHSHNVRGQGRFLSRPKWLERTGRGDWLGSVCDWKWGCCSHGLNFLPAPREGSIWASLLACPHTGQAVKQGGMGLQNRQPRNIKSGLRIFIPTHPWCVTDDLDMPCFMWLNLNLFNEAITGLYEACCPSTIREVKVLLNVLFKSLVFIVIFKMSVPQRTLLESEKTTHTTGAELCKSYKGLVSGIYKGLL